MDRLNRQFIRTIMPVLLLLVLAGCSGSTNQQIQIDTTAIFEQALLTATYAVPTTDVPIATPVPTSLPIPTAEPTLPQVNRTPPDLPPIYTSELLNPLDYPHVYIENTCEFLRNKWLPEKSIPGTVVMPIMFHSIIDGDAIQPDMITREDFELLMRSLHEQNFVPISTNQLRDFLYENAKIPDRSILLIVDDRHYADYFEVWFQPFMEEYGWDAPVINAWISHPETLLAVYDGNIRLNQQGLVDHQAHGVVHNINIQEWTPDTVIETAIYGTVTAEQFVRNELAGSISTIEEKYGEKPIAYIWPGGGFSLLGAQIGREVGYELGFTINPRGPVMYNWIPLSDSADPARPSYLPEGYINDPLMVLPRYWDTDALYHIDTVRTIGKEYAAIAQQQRDVELEYYEIVCSAEYGPIETSAP